MNYAPFAAALMLAALPFAAQATPIAYTPLVSGDTAGSVAAESGPFGGAENWSYWTFDLEFLKKATITVTPISADFDVVIAVFYGQEADSDFYADMLSGGLTSVPVDFADGLTPFDTGVGVPAQVRFTNTFGNAPFVLAIADYTDGLGASPLDYTISAQIPEAQTLALMLAGLGGFALARRRKA
jgi:hypothetical protein